MSFKEQFTVLRTVFFGLIILVCFLYILRQFYLKSRFGSWKNLFEHSYLESIFIPESQLDQEKWKKYYKIGWGLLVASSPMFWLVLVLRFTIEDQNAISSNDAGYLIFNIIMNILAIFFGFCLTFVIFFYACIVQSQGFYLKLSTPKPRFQFVYESIMRSLITSSLYASIQLGIVIMCFIRGDHDPRIIMINPLLNLAKSINQLQFFFSIDSTYRNVARQKIEAHMRDLRHFISKNFQFKSLKEEFLEIQAMKRSSLMNDQSNDSIFTGSINNTQNQSEFTQFLEEKRSIVRENYQQILKLREEGEITGMLSNNGWCDQIILKTVSCLLLLVLPLLMIVISVMATINMIQVDIYNDNGQAAKISTLNEAIDRIVNYSIKTIEVPSYYEPGRNENQEMQDNACTIIFSLVVLLEYFCIILIPSVLRKQSLNKSTRDLISNQYRERFSFSQNRSLSTGYVQRSHSIAESSS